jgi:hypothetical protein
MPDQAKPKYARERGLFWLALAAGLALLYVSTRDAFGKFPTKLAEGIGTALILACVMDAFFRSLVARVRARDYRDQDAFRKLLDEHKASFEQFTQARETAQQLTRPLAAIEARLDKIEGALAERQAR